jgi:PAS domain S-box-containing protein
MRDDGEHKSFAVRLTLLPAATRYAIAVVAVGVAALLRYAFSPLWNPFDHRFNTFYLAVMLSAWLGGLGPGLLATSLSAVAAVYFWPIHTSGISGPGDIATLLVFVTTGTFVSILNEAWRRREAATLRSENKEREARAEAERVAQDLSRLTQDLRAAQERINQLIESVPGIVWESRGRPGSAEHRIDFMSDHVRTLLGYPAEEWLRTPNFWMSVIPPDDRDRAARVAIDGFDRGEPHVNQFRCISKDGRVLWVEARATVIRDQTGNPIGKRGVTIDITDLKRAEQERTESLERERRARGQAEQAARQLRGLQSVTDIALSNLELAVLMRELLDRVRTILRADTASILLTEADGQHLVSAASYGLREAIRENVRIPIGRGVAGEIAKSERGLIVNDLREIEVLSPYLREHVKCLIGAPLRISGQLLGVIHVGSAAQRQFTDDDLHLLSLVAERIALAIERARLHEAERAARIAAETAQQRLRFALEAGRMGTWEFGIRTGKVTWSPALEEIHGFEPGTFPGTFEAFRDEIHPDDRDRVLFAVGEAIAGRRDHQIEYRIVRTDGSVRWVEGRGQILLDATGQPERMVGVCADVTERKQAEDAERLAKAETERANRLKDDFLAMLSHDLRTPLSSILGWAYILNSRAVPAEKTQQALLAIEQSAKTATNLVNSLLDLSRIMSGKLHLDMKPQDLAPVLSSSVDIIRPEAEAKGLRIDLDTIPLSPAIVLADATRIQQVVWNLLSNAVKFTPAGGRIVVRLEVTNWEVQIQVHDTGQGIRAEFLPQVFDRFAQAESRQGAGLGLGLAIVRELIQSHGGAIRAESPGEGRGSTFTVSLPRIPLANELEAAPPERKPVSETYEESIVGAEVLVVDDNADARQLLTTVLESRGAIVQSVSSAAEALDVIRGKRPDVLLADLQMPGEDGYALVQKLRALEREHGCSRLPAIAVTAYATSGDRRETAAGGFDGYVSKPFEIAEIVRIVAAFKPKAKAQAGP